jgi:hypothetical protein
MKIKLNLKFVLSFVALIFVMHEAHEIVHTSVGRIICGCWGERDFNAWQLCKGCAEAHPISVISTFVGPLFTFILIWYGTSFLKPTNSDTQKSFGFALLFANMPFARIITAIFGGGDEVWGLNEILHNHPLAWGIGLTAILLITAYPLYKAFIIIENKYRIGWFLLFFLTPVFIDLLLVLGVMNTLLEKGVLSQYWILGSPMLVTVWTILVTVVFIVMRKSIYTLAKKEVL